MSKQDIPRGSSQSVEDFLKAIYRLQRAADRVSTSALAEALNISAPAVTDMAQRLGGGGHRRLPEIPRRSAHGYTGERVAL